MCGIYGWDLRESDISSEQRAVLASLLGYYNVSRGPDSWGIYNPDGDRITKKLGEITEVAWKASKYARVFAHTRFATHGGKTIMNAHPFRLAGKAGEIVGAHNGIIYNHDSLNKKLDRNFEVDSQHIFQHLADGESDFNDLSGYGSIWFHHLGKAFICKMSGGDLSVYGIRKNGNSSSPTVGVVFSSADEHLKKALKSAGLWHRAFPYKIKEGEVYHIDHQLYATESKIELKSFYGAMGSSWRSGEDDDEGYDAWMRGRGWAGDSVHSYISKSESGYEKFNKGKGYSGTHGMVSQSTHGHTSQTDSLFEKKKGLEDTQPKVVLDDGAVSPNGRTVSADDSKALVVVSKNIDEASADAIDEIIRAHRAATK